MPGHRPASFPIGQKLRRNLWIHIPGAKLGCRPRCTYRCCANGSWDVAHPGKFRELVASNGQGFFKRTQLHETLGRSEEHTSELQSLMRISYAVFCLKKKIKHK